ncbi:MAG: T9SS type A sorting domain-containing protein [Chitinophagaceae bacterium]|nr:T9SS type A sorting domain-containing protein [Chitinophagaceae bacterium]
MKKNYNLKHTLFLCPLLIAYAVSAQNLITNPSAEATPTSNGWTAAQTAGTSCYTGSGWGIQGNQNGFPVAQSGSRLFFPGCGGATGSGKVYELYQDISVAANATAIDAGNYVVSFSGYMHSYNQSTPDATEMIVQYRNAANTILSSYSTGTATHTAGWVRYSDTRTAPVGTRRIRVRLIGTSHNGDSVDSYFDNLSLTASIILPVNFIAFTAISNNAGVLLRWETSNEINNSGFYIERSADGVNWEAIGFVAAKTESGTSFHYGYSDMQPATGTTYYRLKQVDFDGQFAYSEIRSIRHQTAGRTVVFPNPAENMLSIVTPEKRFQGQILNPGGSVVARFGNQKTINVQSLPAGVYYLRLIFPNRTENIKFLKR